MTQDEIIRSPLGREQLVALAREAGFFEFNVEGWINEFERFAALVAAHERNRHAWTQEHWTEYEHAIAAAEREACAKVADSAIDENKSNKTLVNNVLEHAIYEGAIRQATNIADAIRARSN